MTSTIIIAAAFTYIIAKLGPVDVSMASLFSLSAIVNLVHVIAFFLLYGYLQKSADAGYLLVFGIGSYMCILNRKALLFFAIYVASWWMQMEYLQFISFLCIEAFYLFAVGGTLDDATVKLQPFEKEIRQFLFKADPSKLHKVDSLLSKYKGKESELLRKLKTKYSSEDNLKSPQSAPPSSTKASSSKALQDSLKKSRPSYSIANDDILSPPIMSPSVPQQPGFDHRTYPMKNPEHSFGFNGSQNTTPINAHYQADYNSTFSGGAGRGEYNTASSSSSHRDSRRAAPFTQASPLDYPSTYGSHQPYSIKRENERSDDYMYASRDSAYYR
ncbi:hypothetical protein EON65_19545 [archaeon]|nr:MAG: hypothetical protein EON65_19545 [archaeon]